MTPRVERHVAAIIDRIRAVVPETLPVDLAVAPSKELPYLVIYPYPGDVAQDRLCGGRANLLLRFEVEASAEGGEQALWALDHARAALLGHRLAVDGAVAAPIDQIDGSELMRRDTVTQPPMYSIDAVFRLFSQTVVAA